MVIFILEKAPTGLRGELTRWLLEPKSGVFAGNVSAMVRDRLWIRVCKSLKGGSAMMIHNANNEQGFKIEFFGNTSRKVTNWDGLQLISIP